MPEPMDPKAERQLAVDLFNEVWTLMENPARTADEDLRMIHSAHASRFHWEQVGGPEHRARGEWQCSRMYAVLGRAEPSQYHAERCLSICQENGIGDWDLAFAYEALARASKVAGDAAEQARWLSLAREATASVADDDDREAVEQDLADL